jgi:putative hydrolase of HD superfamily
MERLKQQMAFILELDKMKEILRRNVVTVSRRRENDGEHSFHIAVMAMTLREYAPPGTDIFKAVKMCLLHDIVEIDSGDVYCYDQQGQKGKHEREEAAAERIFGMLPPEQGEEYVKLWREFDAMETPEAQFAACMDRLQPMLLNLNTEGHSWKLGDVHKADVLKRNAVARHMHPDIMAFIEESIEKAVEKGYIKP